MGLMIWRSQIRFDRLSNRSLSISNSFLHIRVIEIFLHEPQLESLILDSEGNLFEHFSAEEGVKLYDIFVGAAEDHALEALLEHEAVEERDAMKFIDIFFLGNTVMGNPTGIDILTAFKTFQIHRLYQFLTLSLQLLEKGNLRFLRVLSCLLVFI